MSAGKRAIRVGDQLLREMADLLMKKVKDPRVDGATLTGIRLSNNLRHAKVYFSVLGDEDEVRKTQAGLDSAKGFIKREMGPRLDLRYMPEIVFIHDPTLKRSNDLDKLFQKLKLDAVSDSGN